MNKKSLPLTLYQTLAMHASVEDISDDEELNDILDKLHALNTKVEQIKQKALAKRQHQVLQLDNYR